MWRAAEQMFDLRMSDVGSRDRRQGLARRWRRSLGAGVSLVTISLLIAGGVDAPVRAQTAVPAKTADAGANSAIELMLEKAQFWSSKDRPSVAMDFYLRVLSLQPDNRDALAGASKAAFDLGHDSEAHAYLDRLRKIAPDDPFITEFDTLHRRSPEETAILEQARQLALHDQKAEALAKYRQLFKGNKVPLDLAVDYYPLYVSTLSDESVEADQALTEVAQLADQNPKNINLQLAAAWSQILNGAARSDGIARLKELVKIPAMTQQCTALWRQALIWEGSSFEAQAELEDYLKDHPIDPELQAKREQYVRDLPDISVRSRWKAGDAIGAKDYKTAEEQLNLALSHDRADGESLAMLALVYKLDGRGRDWRPLFKEAVKNSPDDEASYAHMLGLDAEKAVNDQYAKVKTLTDAGHYDEAEALLRSLIGGRRDSGSYLQLASIQTKAGKPDAAMESLRMSLSADPSNPGANEAMALVLIGQNRTAEARPLLARAEEGFQKRHDEHGLALVRGDRADLMRADALQITDPVAREKALREALAVDPSSWWIKLELARTLKDEKRDSEAETIIDTAYHTATAPGAMDTQDGQDATQVAFVWAQENNDNKRADALLKLVPVGKRTASMAKFVAMNDFKLKVRKIAASDDPKATSTLMQLAAAPDPTGERGTEIGTAFLRMQDVESMRYALATSLEATQPPTPSQRISYAGVLLQASQYSAASDVLAPLAGQKLSAAEHDGLENAKDALALGRLEALLQQKRYGEAQQIIMARLAVHPDNKSLLAANARIQIALGNAAGASTQLTAVLEKDPGNLSVRLALIEAEMKLEHYATASDLAQDGMVMFPRNPYLVIQAAQAARARGFNSQALDLMVKARGMLAQADSPAPRRQTN